MNVDVEVLLKEKKVKIGSCRKFKQYTAFNVLFSISLGLTLVIIFLIKHYFAPFINRLDSSSPA